MIRGTLLLVATLTVSAVTVSSFQSSIGPAPRILTPPEGAASRAGTWVEAVLAHQPGARDDGFLRVSRWSTDAIERLPIEVASIRRLLRDRYTKSFPFPFELVDNLSLRVAASSDVETRYSRSERDTLDQAAQSIKNAGLGQSDFVTRAIVLHTDIARLDRAAGNLLRFTDGQPLERAQSRADHWRMADTLADMLRKGDGRDADLAFWYRATLAHMASTRLWISSHAQRAVQRFDDDANVLYLAGCLHEQLAAASTQASLAASGSANRDKAGIGSERAELADAVTRFRRALERDRSHVEARLHYGRTLTLSDKPAAAIAELRRAVLEVKEPPQLYYAQLFLGSALEANKQLDEAQSAYAAAATLFPDAQSTRVALSQLAASRGDRRGAVQAIEPILAASAKDRTDPWWGYLTSCGRDADRLLEEAARRLTAVRH